MTVETTRPRAPHFGILILTPSTRTLKYSQPSIEYKSFLVRMVSGQLSSSSLKIKGAKPVKPYSLSILWLS